MYFDETLGHRYSPKGSCFDYSIIIHTNKQMNNKYDAQ